MWSKSKPTTFEGGQSCIAPSRPFSGPPNGTVVLVCLKDELRTSASFARTVRTALRRMAIDVPLRGRWLTLTTAPEVFAVVNDDKSVVGLIDAPPTAPLSEDDSDVRIVALC